VISDAGDKYLEYFIEKPSLRNFLDFSNRFSHEVGLMSDEVGELVDYFTSSDDILGASMAMLGNTAFAFAYDEDTFRTSGIEGLHVDKLNNKGIVYD
jgi:pantoate kinase